MERPVIGVLSLQGSVEEHLKALNQLEGITAIEVKTPAALARVHGLILPGGESTAIVRLLRAFGLFEPLRKRLAAKMPAWGTCAGMILLAKRIVGEPPHLGVMDVTVRRNAYGRQMESFTTEQVIPAFGPDPAPLVFIRAPWIEEAGEGVEILCRVQDRIVAARQHNLLATSFHPELTGNLSAHRYFASMVREAVL